MREILRLIWGHSFDSNLIEKQLKLCESRDNEGHVHYSDFRNVIVGWKEKQSSKVLGDETILEAFVACGGQPNGDGIVDTKKLVEIIKEQF